MPTIFSSFPSSLSAPSPSPCRGLSVRSPSTTPLSSDTSVSCNRLLLRSTAARSCWVIIKNNVYDLTDFLPDHPGGSQIILKYAGRDATRAYEPIHPPDALEKHLPASKHLGPLDVESSLQIAKLEGDKRETKDEIRVREARNHQPPLERILSLDDMEAVARSVLSRKAIEYYSSASDDEISNGENARAFSRFFFRARVMRPVSQCSPATTILGCWSSLPIFVSASGLAKLGHPDGEINITKAAGATSIIQMVSSNASLSYSSIMDAALPEQTLFFQLYKHRDNSVAEKRIRDIEALGYKAIFLTVDAIVAGNRERDIRSSWVLEDEETGSPPVWRENDTKVGGGEANIFGTAGALVGNDDRDMTWDTTIPWIRSITKLPLVIKGIQCVEEAILAVEAGVDGILLSNHGGRQLDYSMPPMEVLYRLRLQRPDVFDKIEVYIDGGVKRGTDVVKALCLGATAVGLGRPFLYAQSAYGVAGVSKIIQVLEREIVTAMRLIGACSVSDLNPSMVERVDWQPVLRSKL